MVSTGRGELAVTVNVDERAGTVDFRMEPAPGVEAVASSRVVPNGTGAGYLFTQFQQPGTSTRCSGSSATRSAPSAWPSRRSRRSCARCRRRRAVRARLRRRRRGRQRGRRAAGGGGGRRRPRLALRMVRHPQDAEDPTQEALVRIVTRPGSFRGEAAFRTWPYRVAAHLINRGRSRMEREDLMFRRFAEDLPEGLADRAAEGPDAALLAEEVKLGCTPGDAAVPGSGAAPGLRARRRPGSVGRRCRLRLRRQIPPPSASGPAGPAPGCGRSWPSTAGWWAPRPPAAATGGPRPPSSSAGRTPGRLLFARRHEAVGAVAEMERLHDLGSLMRDHPDYWAPGAVVERARDLIASARFRLLSED